MIAQVDLLGALAGADPAVLAAAEELMAAAGYIAFAMRDGAVFERDYAAQRLKDAHTACKAPPEVINA